MLTRTLYWRPEVYYLTGSHELHGLHLVVELFEELLELSLPGGVEVLVRPVVARSGVERPQAARGYGGAHPCNLSAGESLPDVFHALGGGQLVAAVHGVLEQADAGVGYVERLHGADGESRADDAGLVRKDGLAGSGRVPPVVGLAIDQPHGPHPALLDHLQLHVVESRYFQGSHVSGCSTCRS